MVSSGGGEQFLGGAEPLSTNRLLLAGHHSSDRPSGATDFSRMMKEEILSDIVEDAIMMTKEECRQMPGADG